MKEYENKWIEPNVLYAEDVSLLSAGNEDIAIAAAVGAIAAPALVSGVASVAIALTITKGYVNKPERR